jgi:hypothetical protein
MDPINRLPPEIMGTIFSYYAVEDTNAPEKLSAVCRGWKEIIEGDPLLWVDIVLNHPYHFIFTSRVTKWLKNSATCPVKLVIDVPSVILNIFPVMLLLSNHVSRFRALDLCSKSGSVIAQILSILGLHGSSSRPAPLLEALIVDLHADVSNCDLSALESGFAPCPRLRTLALPAACLPPGQSNIFLNVTHLILADPAGCAIPDVSVMLDIFKHTPKVLKYTYGGMDEFSYQHIIDLDLVHVPDLWAVDLTAPGCGLDVLRCLDAPSLRDIRFDGWREEGYTGGWSELLFDDLHDTFASLSQRSKNIQRIDLHAINMREHDCRCLFQDFPKLESLRLILSNITDEAFVGATCPNLKHLELQRCENITGQGLLSFVEGRNLVSGDTFKLTILDCNTISPDEVESLSRYVVWRQPSQFVRHRWSYIIKQD